MEALRENAVSGSPDLNGKLGDVMLAAPDIDLNVFRQQLARLDPSHVFVLVASNDRALSLSRTLAGDRQLSARSTPIIPVIARRSKTLASRPTIFRASRARHLCRRTPSGAHDWRADHRTAAAGANAQAVLGEKPVDSKIMAPSRSRR